MNSALQLAMFSALLMAPIVAFAETSGLDPEVAAVIEAARVAGLPVSSLESKAREGAAKGVPPARVAAHLGSLRADLDRAVTLLGPTAAGADREALLSGLAAALRAHASAAALKQLLALPPALRAQAARSLADLVTAGCTEADVLALIDRAARGPNPSTALHAAVTRAVTLIGQGQSPSLAAGYAAEEAGEGGGPAWDKDKDKGSGHGKDNAPGQQKK